MADARDEQRRSASFLDEVNARLSEAARTGAPLELIFAVRGRVEPVPGRHGQRWRLRTGRGHIVTFRPEFLIAFSGNNHAHQERPTSGRQTAPAGPS